jgi:hypothetical protein
MEKLPNIVMTVHGSHLYGTNTENSDVDYKGLYINTSFRDFILNNETNHYQSSTGPKDGKNNPGDIDISLFELRKFIKLVCDGEMIAIDMIHTPDSMYVNRTGEYFEIWKHIQNNRKMFYSKNMKAYVGYARKQAAKYGLKGSRLSSLEKLVIVTENLGQYNPCYLRDLFDMSDSMPINEHCFLVEAEIKGTGSQKFYEVLGSKYQLSMLYSDFRQAILNKWSKYGERSNAAKNNEGVDWKAISHAFRACYQLKEIFETGDLIYPLKDREFLRDIKLGKASWNEIQPLLEQSIDDLHVLSSKSNYPETVDKDYWDNFIVDVYRAILI